ncbi:hypothetical protein BGLA2_180003 [Burkholderia gladioli]|nr:hypothetical protein BGLA2_180003 [Burkholderia gladioli]
MPESLWVCPFGGAAARNPGCRTLSRRVPANVREAKGLVNLRKFTSLGDRRAGRGCRPRTPLRGRRHRRAAWGQVGGQPVDRAGTSLPEAVDKPVDESGDKLGIKRGQVVDKPGNARG